MLPRTAARRARQRAGQTARRPDAPAKQRTSVARAPPAARIPELARALPAPTPAVIAAARAWELALAATLALAAATLALGGDAGTGGYAPECHGAAAAVTGDLFDPDQVYLVGTLIEGGCGRDAVAHWGSPDSAVVGFHCHVDERSARIRPTDGRLLYTNVFEDLLREFHEDDWPSPDSVYPDAPLDNDTVLPTPPCTDGLDPLAGFLVSPTGTVLHRCRSDAATWYDETGRVAYAESKAPAAPPGPRQSRARRMAGRSPRHVDVAAHHRPPGGRTAALHRARQGA